MFRPWFIWHSGGPMRWPLDLNSHLTNIPNICNSTLMPKTEYERNIKLIFEHSRTFFIGRITYIKHFIRYSDWLNLTKCSQICKSEEIKTKSQKFGSNLREHKSVGRLVPHTSHLKPNKQITRSEILLILGCFVCVIFKCDLTKVG